MTKKGLGHFRIDVKNKLSALKVDLSAEITKKIGDLTYDECDDFATELAHATTAKKARTILSDHWNKCTLQERVSKAHLSKKGQTTWAERCKKEARRSH